MPDAFPIGSRVRMKKRPKETGTVVDVVSVRWDWADPFVRGADTFYTLVDGIETLDAEEEQS